LAEFQGKIYQGKLLTGRAAYYIILEIV